MNDDPGRWLRYQPSPEELQELEEARQACEVATRKAIRRRSHKRTKRKLTRRKPVILCDGCGSFEVTCMKCGRHQNIPYDPTRGGLLTAEEVEAREREVCKGLRSKIEEKYRFLTEIGYDLHLDRHERYGGSYHLSQILKGERGP